MSTGLNDKNFSELRRDGSYYVDKTDLVYELIHDRKSKVTLFTRPRRFGKTLMMSMIENFFDISCDSRELFAGLRISKHQDFCKQW
ncbi:MAG: AAA family ATPase, partial [Clostridiales bacterium]|nr:AAA family ATPase [Clostridiales bacterium]